MCTPLWITSAKPARAMDSNILLDTWLKECRCWTLGKPLQEASILFFRPVNFLRDGEGKATLVDLGLPNLCGERLRAPRDGHQIPIWNLTGMDLIRDRLYATSHPSLCGEGLLLPPQGIPCDGACGRNTQPYKWIVGRAVCWIG